MPQTQGTQRKKVLVLTENFPPKSGGSGRWFWELYSRLPKEDYIIVTDTVDDSAINKQINNTVIRIPLKSTEWGFKSVTGLGFYWRTAIQVRKLTKEHGITHIHCGRVIHEGVIAWLVSLFTNVQFVCFIHGEDIETAATSREQSLMVKQVCGKADMLICNSLNSQNIARRLNYDVGNTVVLHPGADCERFIPVTSDLEFKQDMGWTEHSVILTVGRLQARKGHDKMIGAMPNILAAHPKTLYCIIGDGDQKPRLLKLVSELKLEKNVLFLNEISDEQMIKCYQQCDIFILPNRTIANDIEGFGMVLVEAQACGKVVIAGDSGGTAETMLAEQTGFIIDCTNPDVIATKINQLLSDTALTKSMGEKGVEFVNEMFDWKAHVVKAKKLFT
jgi:phosphatidylinositol alpha-1,6-mannosyltransferase